MRISVIPNRCQGHARCEAAAPGLFTMDESGYNVTEHLEVPQGREGEAELAVENCPERALVIED